MSYGFDPIERMAEAVSKWAFAKELVGYYVRNVWRLLNERPIFLWGQAIAFKVLVTIVPIVVLATGVIGQILRGDAAFESVADYIRAFVPYQNDRLIGLLHQLQRSSTTITLLGLLGLLFSVMTLFTSFRVVIGSIFQEEYHVQRTVLRGYVFDLRMAAQVSLLFLLSFGLSLGMQAIDQAGTAFFEQAGYDAGWLTATWRSLFYTLGLVLPLLLSVGMFFQLFYFVPKPHPPKRSALLGAVVTALLWDAAKYLFTFYAARSSRFSRYNSAPGDDPMGVLVSGFGLVIAFVFWVYYSGIVLCVGAFFAMLHERRYRARRKLKHTANVDAEGRPVKLGLPPARDLLARHRARAREDLPMG